MRAFNMPSWMARRFSSTAVTPAAPRAIATEMVAGLSEGGRRLSEARVVDWACAARQRRGGARAVKAEAPAARRWHRLELATKAVAPRIVHPKHRRVRRQPQSRARHARGTAA